MPQLIVPSVPVPACVTGDQHLQVVVPDTLPQTQDDVLRLTTSCGYSPVLRRSQLFMEESCRALQLVPTGSLVPSWGPRQIQVDVQDGNRSDVWANVSASFAVHSRCERCVLVLEVDQIEWVSYWGSSAFISDLTIERVAVDVPARV